MENASKAIIMAGGMLIAVLTIGLVVMVLTNASQNYQSQDDIQQIEQIAEFNLEFESYNRKLLRGTEIISLCNKAISNNKKYEDVPERQITINFQLIESLTTNSLRAGQIYSVNSNTSSTYKTITNNKNDFDEFKRKVFDCTGTTYHDINGLIESLTFKEKKVYDTDK